MVPSWQELLSVKRNYWVIPLLPVFYLLFGPKKREEEKRMYILGIEHKRDDRQTFMLPAVHKSEALM